MAVFDFAEEVGDEQATRVTVRLHHYFPSGTALLGRFRLSFTNDAATLQATRIRFDLKEGELVELAVLLATALVQQGQRDEAVTTLLKALDPTTDRAAKAKIVTEAAPLEGVLEQLTERAAADGPLQAELARHFAQRGNNQLADAAVTRARPLLQAQLVKEPENNALAGELADLLLAEPTRWTVLRPAEMTADGGATLTRLEDNSILVSGPNPERDVYTLSFRDLPARLQHLRLEVLPHESLPGNGPGRSPNNGNFHLTTIKAQWDPPTNKSEPRNLKLARAGADFNQQGFSVATAIDANDSTGWGIHPEMGKPHCALFELVEPVTAAAGTVLRVTLECKYGWQHNLGRFRLSVCGDPAALDREEKRLAVVNLTDPWARLAAAYARNGRNEEASQGFGKALQRASSYEARKPIVEVAARFDEVLSALSRGQPDDPQLQLALARQHAERGKQRLAEKQPASAQVELEKARAILTRFRAEPRWTVLTATEIKSAGGTTLTKLNDNSILASGKNPETDTYTFVAQTDLPRITAFRLEAMAHESLPRGGPGRVDWGNFALSEISLQAEPLADASKAAPRKITKALADFEQTNYPVATALDGNPGTAWSIDPQVGNNHWSVFELEPSQQPGLAGGTKLTFTLDFQFNVRHALGRFRLSVTSEATALQATMLRLDLKDGAVADMHVALATAHAQQGHTAEAVDSFTAALELAADRAGKATVIAAAAPLEGVLEKLAERAAGDGRFQAELARHYAERGNAALAAAARAKARALFQQQLAAEPDDVAPAAELGDLLWSTLPPLDYFWIDDAAPPGANLQGDTPWEFVSRPDHPVFRGKTSMRRRAQGTGQHFFTGAAPGLQIGEDTRLFAHVFLDPQDPPKTVMLQFLVGGSWEHRACWGADSISWGAPGTASRLPMGPLPQAGAWVRLEVEARKVGLSAGMVLDGWAFTQFDGTCYWDAAGITTTHFDTPWQKLAAAYHLRGDKQALASLLQQHPAAAAGIGAVYAAAQDWQQAIAEYSKAVTNQPADVALLTKLAAAYQSAGRTREAVPHLANVYAASPQDTLLALKVAALQAWFGQDKELAATRQQFLAVTKGTNDARMAERAAKVCSIRAAADKADLESALALARKAVEIEKHQEWNLLALGMAEYRSGNDAAADQALRDAAAKAGSNNPMVTGIAAFYRALSLFRQGKQDEARALASAAAAKLQPLPRDENNPLVGAANHDDLILWLAYKEVQALTQPAATPPPQVENDK